MGVFEDELPDLSVDSDKAQRRIGEATILGYDSTAEASTP